MGTRSSGWPELDRDEWMRGRWPARCLRHPTGTCSPESVGTLILTNRRLVFAGRTSLDEFAEFAFDELTAVRCTRQGLSLNTLIVETSAGECFVFKTKRLACKKIEARSQMRLLTRR